MSESDTKLMAKPIHTTTSIVKIFTEPITFFKIIKESDEALENRKEAIDRGDEFPPPYFNEITCPTCENSHQVIRKVRFDVYDINTRKAFEMELPEEAARIAFTKAYNTLLQRIRRSIEARGFWSKVKTLFSKDIIVFPSPSNTIWTITEDEHENVFITADFE